MKAVDSRSEKDLLQTIESLKKELKDYREYDPLTGLYNKETFYRKAEELLAVKSETQYAIVCLDIERFKLINDLYGTKEGDKLIRYLGEKISNRTASHAEIAARITGDIFVAFVEMENGLVQLIENNVLDWLRQYPLDMEIIPAIGIYYIQDKTLPASLMSDRAVLAAQSVKGNYMRHMAEYHSGLMASILQEQDIFDSAERALKNREFKVYIQPKCDARNGKIVGAEALARWIRPQKGLLSPDAFIPTFEKSGFITKLDAYVWEEVCKLLRKWIDCGQTPIPISVNVSRKSLYHSNVYDFLIELIEKYRLDPKLLELEVTESAYTESMEQILDVLSRLRAAGFTILMDDFGSGYSSLNMLKDISVDVLKIDLRFLENFNEQSHRSENIVESIIRMAKWLKLCVIAEGVETSEQVDFLLGANCPYAQGFYFYKPMPIEEFEALLFDDSKVDYKGMVAPDQREITFEDLFQSGMMSKKLLNNIIGGVALYEYYQGNLAIIRVNDGYYRITGCNPDALRIKGQHILDRVPDEDKPIVLDALEQAKNDPSREVEIQFRRLRLCGTLMWMHMRLFFLSESGGRDIYYASINDITQQKEAEAQLRQSEELYRTAMLSTNRFPFMFDVEKRSVTFDANKQTLFGTDQYTSDVPECMIKIGLVAPEHEQRLHDFFYDVIDGKPSSTQEARVRTRDGSYCWKRASMTTIFDQFGQPVKAFGVLEDITREHELENRLRQGEKRLSDLKSENQLAAVSLLNDMAICGLIGGYCEENFPLYFINDKMIGLMGYDSHEDFIRYTGGFVGNTIHPDDLSRVARELGSDYYEGQEYIVEYRTLRKDGSFFWTLDKGRVVKAEDGRLAIISVCIDLSQQQQSEEMLRLADSRFRIAMQLTHADIWEYDIPSKTIIRFDPEDTWVKSPEKISDAPECLIKRGWIHPDSADTALRAIRAIEEGALRNACEIQALCKDGQYRWFRLTCTVIQQKDGKPMRVLGVSENIDGQKEKEFQYDRLLQNSQRDSLTGLYTRKTFEAKALKILEGLNGNSPVSAMLLFDVDNFKQVNDTLGHIRGDQILREIAQVTYEIFGDDAVAGRFGGDEFALIVTDAAYESDVCNSVERFLERLHELHTNEKMPVTTSVGIAFTDGSNLERLYQMADTALYQAKGAGKNTYAVYSSDETDQRLYFNIDPTILDELEGLIYIINQKDYSLLYCNQTLCERYGWKANEYKNQKCYRALRGQEAPCPGCAERKLNHDQFVVHNGCDIRGITYEIREKLLSWGKHELRLEIARKLEK
ncbi:hypothetical protein CE91St36_00540 [Christensenellaceae bacterium]|nr:hypothetical protein CE91St36_00540 [Christensenellaceae bacterium]BDF59904.1 hypothetical protein CE91St37_00540 [Christensenellaceae bacterium]